MKNNNSSERHIVNNLKVVLNFDSFYNCSSKFMEIQKNQIISFLNSKIKSAEADPEKKWITTWNHYLNHLKFFFRWLHNEYMGLGDESKEISDWITPSFIRIKMKRTKRLSPYSQTNIWDRDELLTIINYEPSKRNKAALSLFWDLDARNHEVTLLKIKNIRLREKYGEGEVPHESKTGSGPILLTLSFPYVRDWINEHPFKNELEARLICNRNTGAPLKPEAMWTMLKQLQIRISRLVESNEIKDAQEKEKLEYLLRAKKWNPYCLRHSSISADSDYLPEYALKKKVRWVMNSRQGARYIKRRMGNDLKDKILEHNGIITSEYKSKKPSISNCPRCSLVNTFENSYCDSCSYPLKPSAFDDIKASEQENLRTIQQQHEQNINNLKEEMNQKFTQILSLIQQNPAVANIKPEILKKII